MLNPTRLTDQVISVRKRAEVTFRSPTADDGADVWKIVASCQPLDRNSVYCNLLQCTDFADTCVLAERHGQPVGWVSAYRPPDSPETLFIWQVAVMPEARGLGLAKRMVMALLERPACKTVTHIKTTITPDNEASWSLFDAVADALNAPLHQQAWFDHKVHFRGRHETEHMVTIGPFAKPKRKPRNRVPGIPVAVAHTATF